MSFRCKNCGLVNKRIKQQRVPITVRKVKYVYRIKVEEMGAQENGLPTILNTYYRTVKESNGTEIEKEYIYCPNCIPKDVVPEVVGEEVTKTIDLKTVQERKRERRGFRKFRR